MKALKIDIIKEEVDIPAGFDCLEESLYSPIQPIKMNDGTELSPGLHTIKYKVVELAAKTGQIDRYAVKINDAGLFLDLLKVSTDQYITVEDHKRIMREDQETRFKKYQETVAAETKDALQKLTLMVQTNTLKRFWNLPWWKRLFKQF
jgi:hypothetical protein